MTHPDGSRRMIPVERTFCGVPACADLGRIDADAAVFGAPHGTPYEPGTPSHARGGPTAIREALSGLSAGREQFDFDCGQPLMGRARVVDCGDIDGDLHDGAANRRAITETVAAILDRGAMPLLLGGDDSTPIPMIGAYGDRGRPVTIVQVDAHIDWRDEVDGERHGYSSTMRRASEMAHVEGIVQIGARGPGSARDADVREARDWGARIFTAREVHRAGVGAALEAVPEGADVILSIDVDALDPALVPGVLLPAFGGLTYPHMLDLMEGVTARANVVGATFIEYVPENDPQGVGGQAIARLASNLLAMRFPARS